MIHGIGANVEMWSPLDSRLAGRQLIMFDAPGTGRSDLPRVPLRMPGLANVALAVLDQLGVERADVLGYSFGGAVAQQLAHQAPGRVDRLVLAATTCGVGGLPTHPRNLLNMLTPARYHSAEKLAEVAAGLYGGLTARRPDLLAEHFRARNSDPPSSRGYYLQLYAIWGWTSLPWLRGLKQPTLVLAGDDDPLVPPLNARLLALLLPNSHLRLIPGAGHLFLVDQPEVAARALLEFLESAA
jgi:poly(3-hydroxyalkanoate) depolymerase